MRLTTVIVLVILAVAATELAATGEVYFVQADGVELRRGPGDATAVIQRLRQGDEVMEWQRLGSWLEVSVLRSGGTKGWIEEQYLASEPPGSGDFEGFVGDDDTAVGGFVAPKPEFQPALIEFLIAIEGPAAREFKARCRYITESNAERVAKFEGLVPKRYRIQAKAIRCATWSTTMSKLKLSMWGDGQYLGSITRKRSETIILYTDWDW
jgi:uncharacterized protein YgiM (DUF1202 family)